MRKAKKPFGRVAALDLGEVRTGVAVSEPGATLARPLEIVPTGQLVEYLREAVDREDIFEIVVGVPRTMGGEIGFQARRVLDKIETLRAEFPDILFVERDERLTTRLAVVEAHASRRKRSRRGGKERVDHLAAARMLQEHLDARGER